MTEDSSSGNNNSRKNNPESKRNYDVFAALNEAFVIQEGKSKDFLNFVNEKKCQVKGLWIKLEHSPRKIKSAIKKFLLKLI